MKHLKALDGIRAIAVFLVIISHWLEKSYFSQNFSPGVIGVDIFFVLSGFLITNILLQNRIQAELSDNSKKLVIKNFFIRRSLRIFPIYYLFVFSCLIIGPMTNTHIGYNILYFLTYTTNFYFYHIQAWHGTVSHLWSLAVEEQFYLFWPWVILYTPRKYLLLNIIIFISVGIISGYIIASKGLGDLAHTLPFSCFDSFGLGALLAFILVFHKKHLALMHRILGVTAIVCCLQMLSMRTQWPLLLLPERTAYSIIGLWLISYVVLAQEEHRKPLALLTNRALVFLGKISYGMYLYHLPFPWDTNYLYRHFNYRIPASVMPYQAYIVFAENIVLLIMLSWTSWLVLERPILRFKQYFDYQAYKPLLVAKQ
jgi:peptidoglycan/LPS O-acetylase OafA/YrhL